MHEAIKREVAVANRVLAATGLAGGMTAALGHASMRVPDAPDHFIVKGRGYAMDALAAMLPNDMIVCDLEGNFLEGPPGSTQCFEVKMHSCIYKLYPDVQAVVHTHPRFTILMTVLGQAIRPMRQEGVQLVRRELPLYNHMKTVQSDAEGMEVAGLIAGHQAVLLRGHGATTTGATLEQAVMNMLHLEEQAHMNYLAMSAAGPDYGYLPEALIAETQGRTPLAEMPHFRDPIARAGGQPRVGGVWAYYAAQVSTDLDG
ncbi:MAG: class II aldolase/adducin family protein [Chloroflexi bacterium]|nr:class II aldolase/adducin family protein [Chloroflexota bacterium]